VGDGVIVGLKCSFSILGGWTAWRGEERREAKTTDGIV